jgi:AcrR family transcriptional regulator
MAARAKGTVAANRQVRAGRAVLEKGLRRSEEILDAAATLLVEDGYAQLSIRKIAARAGIRPGNLQYYYRTKQDVVRALLDRYLAESVRAIEQRVAASTGTPEARLRSGIEGILADQQVGRSCEFFREIWALAARDRAVARAVQNFYARYRDGVAQALLAVNPALGAACADRRAALVVAMLEGLSVFRFGRRAALEDPALARELPRLVLQLAKEIGP